MFVDDNNNQQPQNSTQQKQGVVPSVEDSSSSQPAAQSNIGQSFIPTNQNSSPPSSQPSTTDNIINTIDPTHLTPPSLSGSGAAFAPSKPPTTQQTPSTNSQPPASNKKLKKKSSKKKAPLVALAILLIVASGGGFYYFTQMTREAEVPTTPTSEPAADEVEPEAPCTLFYSLFLSCGESVCETSADCEYGLECVTAEEEGVGYCSDPDFVEACALDPGYEACCTAPIILECGETNCETDENCEGDLVCIEADDGNNYCSLPEDNYQDACTANPSTFACCDQLGCGDPDCTSNADCLNDLICVVTEIEDEESTASAQIVSYCAEEEFEDACSADPSFETCCEAPEATPTPTPTATPTPPPDATATPTSPPDATSTPKPTQPPYATPLPTKPGEPQTYVVDTQPECNDECEANADCKNISHICYNGRCRLDVNPEDEYCRTPAGETHVERIVETPVAGPREWLDYLKVGIGAIGAGLLLLLLL